MDEYEFIEVKLNCFGLPKPFGSPEVVVFVVGLTRKLFSASAKISTGFMITCIVGFIRLHSSKLVP